VQLEESQFPLRGVVLTIGGDRLFQGFWVVFQDVLLKLENRVGFKRGDRSLMTDAEPDLMKLRIISKF
jgi:hypothetical protein